MMALMGRRWWDPDWGGPVESAAVLTAVLATVLETAVDQCFRYAVIWGLVETFICGNHCGFLRRPWGLISSVDLPTLWN